MIYKNLNKNILFLIAFFFCITLFLLSGCISFCSLGPDDDSECVSYTEAIKLCNEISSTPKGYPICIDFSKESSIEKLPLSKCETIFNENISSKAEYKNLSSNTEQLANNFRYSVINGWKNAETIAFAYHQVHKSCDSFLNGDFTKYKKEIISNAQDLDYHNKEGILYFLSGIFSTKKELEDLNVDLMSDTDLYKDYLNLIAILNEFQKATGRPINVKESLAKDTIDFYINYYSTPEGNEILMKSISELSTQNSDLSFFTNMIGWNVGIGAVLVPGAIPAVVALFKAFELAESIASQVSDVLEITTQKTNLNKWNDLNTLHSMLEAFAKAHGPKSISDKDFFKLLNNMDSDITKAKENVQKKQTELTKEILELEQNFDKKMSDKKIYDVLYSKYQILESPKDLKSKITLLSTKLHAINSLTLGEKHHYLLIYGHEFLTLKQEVDNYLNTDYKTLISLCTSDLIDIKQKVSGYPPSQEKTVIQSYIDLFFNTDDTAKKLIYCSQVLPNFDENLKMDCLSAIFRLNINLGIAQNTGNILESVCEQEMSSKLADAKNSDKYKTLKLLFDRLNFISKNFDTVVNFGSCFTNNEFVNIKTEQEKYKIQTKYTNDFALSVLLTETDLQKYMVNMSNFIDKFDSILNKSISCIFEKEYEVNIENNKLTFNNFFPQQTIDFSVKIPANFIKEIIPSNCLKGAKKTEGYFTLKFGCLSKNMSYSIVSDVQNPEYSILSFSANSSLGYLETKLCLPPSFKADYSVDLPLPENKIINVNVTDDSKFVSSKITTSKLFLLLNSVTSKEKCVFVNYFLEKPLLINSTLSNIVVENRYTNYIYDINLKSDIYLLIPKARVVLDLFSDNKNAEYELKDQYSNKLPVILDSNPQFIYNNLYPMQTVNFYLKKKIKDDANTILDLNGLYLDIIKLRQYSFIPESAIQPLLNELEVIKNTKELTARSKKYFELRKKVNSLLDEAKINLIYVERYKLALDRIKNIKEQYDKTVKILMIDYSFQATKNLDIELIDAKLLEAEVTYNQGDIKGAVKILEGLKINTKNIEDYILDLYNSLLKKTKDLEKQSKKTNAYDKTDFEVLERKASSISQQINSGNYSDALDSLKTYAEVQETVSEKLAKSTKEVSQKTKDLLSKYENYKKKLDNLWSKYSLFDSELNSEHYATIKSFGISFSFSSSSLTQIKNKISAVTKKLIELDKEAKNQETSKEIEDIISFDSGSFDDFFASIDDIDDSLTMYQTEMRNKANAEIVFASSAGKNTSVDFFKAKNAFDENKFVDAIYFAKLSQLADETEKSTDWTLYIGLGFIGILIVLVFIFGRKLEIKKQGKTKETYYNVEKEE